MKSLKIGWVGVLAWIFLFGWIQTAHGAPLPDRLFPERPAQERTFPNTNDLEVDRVIIKFRPLVPEFAQERLHENHNAEVVEQILAPRTVVVRVPIGQAEQLAKMYEQSLFVEFAEPDFTASATYSPNDSYLSEQWNLQRVQAEQGWDISKGSSRVQVAVLDSGIDSDHEDLEGKVEASVNFTQDGMDDEFGHGTHVAGIIGAITDNDAGVASVGHDTHLQSVKVLNDRGSGYYSWIINGIYWATDNGSEVINMSFGSRYRSQALEEALKYAHTNGVVLVAAAGNSNSTDRYYPAYVNDVIAVGATDENDNKSSFSNYGSWVDIAAPGEHIVSTMKDDAYAMYSGTSMAAPHVSALAALVLSTEPGATVEMVREVIEEGSDVSTATINYWQHGRMNVLESLSLAQSGTGGVPTTPEPTPSTLPDPTPSPSPTPTPNPTATPTPTPTPTPEPTPTVTPTPTPTPTPSPVPENEPLPWWCRFVPWHYTCQ